MLIIKHIRNFAKMTPTVVRQPHTASQSSSAHPEPIQCLNLPGILQADLMHLLRNPSERRMYQDLLHFKGQICKQQTNSQSAAIIILQVITGSLFQWGHQGETVAAPGRLHMNPSPLLLLYWDSGRFLATIPTLFFFSHLGHIEALLKIQI